MYKIFLKISYHLQLKKMEESHQEATEKEVERILGYLQRYFADERKHIERNSLVCLLHLHYVGVTVISNRNRCKLPRLLPFWFLTL